MGQDVRSAHSDSDDQSTERERPSRTGGFGITRVDARGPIELARALQVGRFGLIRELGRGGMGQVFLARDVKLGRKVAIKFLLRDDPDFVRRFMVEARATARCTHENIVTIHEVGEHDGLPFMVLEYLEGRPLSKLLETRLTARQLTELVVPVVRALERAHEHGIVHRDLKPSNVFVTTRGQVKVLDFGIACILQTPLAAIEHAARPSAVLEAVSVGDHWLETPSEHGAVIGTTPYMSPEQWGVDAVDHQSDLWAIGIVFWRALVGHHPVGAVGAEQLSARLARLDVPLASIATQDETIPPELARIVDRCLALRKSERYASARELLTDLQAFLSPGLANDSDEICPYRGLASFGEHDARYFFGRSNEVRSGLAQLAQWPLLAVVGPSGVGKSSFVHAGLVPALRASGGNWHVLALRPGRSPLQRLAACVEDEIETGDPSGDVVAQLREAPGVFGALLRRTAERTRRQVLVVVDQLEELFTLVEDPAVRECFLAALLAAADDPSAPVRVVLSMRGDFLDRLAGHARFLAELSRGLYFLTAPGRENLREALVRPAELVGYAFEDDQIVDDMLQVSTSRGALPLLSFAATCLWEARDRDRKLLTLGAYRQMGSIGGAFARHAERVAAEVPPAHQPLLRAILTRLVTPEGTRAVVDPRDLRSLVAVPRDIEDILDKLVRARLVQLQADPDHGSTVELVHEMLISEWPTLARMLGESQGQRGFLDDLRRAAKQWLARGRPADLVWRGTTAQDALAFARRHELELAADEREFLAAVRTQLARGRRRVVAAVASILVVLGAVIAGGAVAVVRISAAEHDAEQHAASAATEARNAQAAQAEVARELEAVKSAQRAREAAEAKQQDAEAAARGASAEVALSREQLEQRNRELQRALAEARDASGRAATANARLATELAKQSREVERLKRELHKIETGPLK